MLILETKENLDWFRKANKYIENQWIAVKGWNGPELEKKFSDEDFEREFDFICSNL